MEEPFDVKNIRFSIANKTGKYTVTSVTNYQLSFTIPAGNTTDPMDLAESIVNPDEDGNYPLRSGELVRGRIKQNTLVVKALRSSTRSPSAKTRCPRGFHRHPPKTGECVDKSSIVRKTRKRRTTTTTT